MREKRISVSLMILFAVCLLFLPAARVFADSPIAFELDSYTFDLGNEDANEWFFTKDGCVRIKDAVSSDKKIVTARFDGGCLIVTPVGKGTATVTVTGEDGSAASIQFTVEKSYFQRQLKDRTRFADDEMTYGAKKIQLFSIPGATGTLTVGKDKYNVKIKDNGSATVKLKRVYKLKTKVSFKAKFQGVTRTIKGKIVSNTSVSSIKAVKKTLSLDCYNLHKGDIVSVVCGGSTYTKKIGKNYANKPKIVKIKTKKTISKKAAVKVTIRNKYKQKLESLSVKLTKGTYFPPEPEEDYEPDNSTSEDE